MGRRVMRAAVCTTIVALVCGASVLPAAASTRPSPVAPGSYVAGSYVAGGASLFDDVVAPVPIDSPTGSYIVLLEEAPATTYRGGRARLSATAPGDGEKFDPHTPAVEKYVTFLRERQAEVAAAADVEPAATYQTVLNGFSASLTPDAAARVAATDGVLAVYPDEVFRPDGVPGGVAERTGRGAAAAANAAARSVEDGQGGAGVVIGVIDTGIAPENPAFAGARLTAKKGVEPYLRGDTIVFDKPDGRQFRSARVSGDDWSTTDYSTKLVGARSFWTGALAAGFGFDGDVVSPRDSDGHGSRAASIAAGESGVEATLGSDITATVSGIAPEAKIAAYKACFVGHDPLSTSDDVCVGSDVLAALDQAVADGVDVISFSIGGGAGASSWAADDIAFLNAATAGIFIAAGAGNAGPSASTVQRAAPWITTVAASTLPAFEATVELSSGVLVPGVSASIAPGDSVSGPLVYAGDVGLAGAADARLCFAGTLDPQLVAGAVVVCDRGTNPRAEKSDEVAAAGGAGMILVNATPDSLDGDLHAVPTVHVDAAYRDAVLAEAGGGTTATLVGEDLTGGGIVAPQIAPFSARGPFGGDVDILAPDLAAPGVTILAADRSDADGDPAWTVASGTSMAAPYVAGLAARHLEVEPAAGPDEIKSALMTTSANTLESDGSATVDPFAQGAGQVSPDRFADPGLVYRGDPSQWRALAAAWAAGGDTDAGDDITANDLNLPSISIGALAREDSATRTLTATRPGTYEVVATIPGVDVTVEPSTLTFDAAGDAQEFTVTFENLTAPVEVWATGFLTWTGEDATTVRIPLAVRPTAVDATGLVSGDGVSGSIDVSVVSGVSGQIELDASGLAPLQLLVDPEDPAPGHSGDASSGDENGNIGWLIDVADGATLAQFTLEASDDSDLDLTVYRVVRVDEQVYDARWVGAPVADGGSEVTLVDPAGGSYLVVVGLSDADDDTTWDLRHAVVESLSSEPLIAAPGSLTAQAGDDVRYTLSWSGLQPDTRYLGVVAYGDSEARSLVRIDSGAGSPVAETAPTVTGPVELGALLSVDPGEWSPDDVVFAYQWLRDGEPISGAEAQAYRVREADVGTTLTARVTATQRGNVNPGTSVSDGVLVSVGSNVDVTMNRHSGAPSDAYTVTVEVVTGRGDPATGAVTVRLGGAEYVGTLARGQVTFTLPAQRPGIHLVVVEYAGSEGVDPSAGLTAFAVRD